jgi:hypothetical protein
LRDHDADALQLVDGDARTELSLENPKFPGFKDIVKCKRRRFSPASGPVCASCSASSTTATEGRRTFGVHRSCGGR